MSTSGTPNGKEAGALIHVDADAFFQPLLRAATVQFDVPSAAITMCTASDLVLKAAAGVKTSAVPLLACLCRTVPVHGDALVIEDLQNDARFSQHPLAGGSEEIRFYAGIGLGKTPEKQQRVLNLWAPAPRSLGPQEREKLRMLATLIADQIQLHHQVAAQADRIRDLEAQQTTLKTMRRRQGTGDAQSSARVHRPTRSSSIPLWDRTSARARNASPAHYQLLIDCVQEVVFQVDAAVRWTFLNNAWTALTGFSVEASLGQRAFNFLHFSDRKAVQHDFLTLVDGAQTEYRREARCVTSTGTIRWVAIHAKLIRTEGGRAIGGGGTIRDITERRKREAALRRATEEAERARAQAEEMNRLKTTFLANMSHEIRTPLTSIIGFAEVIEEELESAHDEGKKQAIATEFAASIQRSGQRLLRTLNAILDLAQLESGSMEIDLHPVNVNEEARQALAQIEPTARRKGLQLHLDHPAEPVWAQADARALRRILDNLLTNAVKFTEAGTVEVQVRQLDPVVELRVQDTGVGIDASFREHLFGAFTQESAGNARRYCGSGLGLAIVKQLIDRMGGQITVESAKRSGSTFTVTLPRPRS